MLKTLNYNNQNSFKTLKLFLDKRKSIQKNQTSVVNKIIKNVKKKGDIAVLNYEKKFSKIRKKIQKIYFSNKEINFILKKNDKELKKAIDLAYNRIKKFHSKQKFSSFKFKDKLTNLIKFLSSAIKID